MIDLEQIKSLGVGPELVAFSEFLIKEKGRKTFPDYQKLDLMKVPQLVPYLWVYDYRGGIDNGFLYHFTGTKIDEYIGFNAMGRTFEQCYSGHHQQDLISKLHKRVYLERRIGFTRRNDVLKIGSIDKPRTIETLSFPCSQGDQHLNFSIGISTYKFGVDAVEPIFRVL